jgi:hypothetical protein
MTLPKTRRSLDTLVTWYQQERWGSPGRETAWYHDAKTKEADEDGHPCSPNKVWEPSPSGCLFSNPWSQCGNLSSAYAKACAFDHANCAFQIVGGNEANILCFQWTPCTKSQEKGLGFGPPRVRDKCLTMSSANEKPVRHQNKSSLSVSTVSTPSYL